MPTNKQDIVLVMLSVLTLLIIIQYFIYCNLNINRSTHQQNNPLSRNFALTYKIK